MDSFFLFFYKMLSGKIKLKTSHSDLKGVTITERDGNRESSEPSSGAINRLDTL